MYFVAEELREVLAELGLKTVEELVGRTDLLQRSRHINPKSKAASLDIEKLLHAVDGPNTKEIAQNHHLDIGFDLNYLYKEAKQSIENGETFKDNIQLIILNEMLV